MDSNRSAFVGEDSVGDPYLFETGARNAVDRCIEERFNLSWLDTDGADSVHVSEYPICSAVARVDVQIRGITFAAALE
jgi:hypothetical protein